jgi:hypothetical protein
MASKKTGLDSLKSAVGGFASRLPFAKRPASTPEPFSAIEDETPIGDLLSSSNAAPGMAAGNSKGEKADFKSLAASAADSALKNTPVLVGIIIVLLFLLALAVTAIIVAAPPKAMPAAAPFTKAGEAVVKAWILPPGDPLAPRMAMERDETAKYSAEDAARLGLDPDPRIAGNFRVKNDADIEDLYRTAP